MFAVSCHAVLLCCCCWNAPVITDEQVDQWKSGVAFAYTARIDVQYIGYTVGAVVFILGIYLTHKGFKAYVYKQWAAFAGVTANGCDPPPPPCRFSLQVLYPQPCAVEGRDGG